MSSTNNLEPMNRHSEEENGATKIYNLIILDESGSMGYIEKQALDGANETIQAIRIAQQESPEDNQMLTFVTFDSSSQRPDVRTLIDCKPIAEVEDITSKQYSPCGCTPLYDAIGTSIDALKSKVREGDHVLVTIITDGYENSSHIYSAQMIYELISSLKSQGWVFTFIGANQDSVISASKIGIKVAMDFEFTKEGSTMMFNKMVSSQRRYYKNVREEKRTGIRQDYENDFFSQKEAQSRVTPSQISELSEGQIFVFGSDINGQHKGGAAALALKKFGAVYGQGSGLQGRSYAIPTTNVPLENIAKEIERFILFADSHPEMTFLVTRIGCGNAGYTDEQIAPLFAKAYSLPNVYLPSEFWRILTYENKNSI